jgi:hypothetical protein
MLYVLEARANEAKSQVPTKPVPPARRILEPSSCSNEIFAFFAILEMSCAITFVYLMSINRKYLPQILFAANQFSSFPPIPSTSKKQIVIFLNF